MTLGFLQNGLGPVFWGMGPFFDLKHIVPPFGFHLRGIYALFGSHLEHFLWAMNRVREEALIAI